MKKPMTFFRPSIWGQTATQRIARLETYVEIASRGHANDKTRKVQLPRYLAELKELQGG